MKPTTPDLIRNVALISHGGAGKTSLAEAMLFDAGAISRLGNVEAGTTALDWDPDEQRRGQSINLAVGSLEHDGVRITIVDTPGYADFQADVVEALAAVDAVIVVVDASAGVEVGTDEVWRLADARGLPRMVFVNKMDRENANYDATLDQLKARFGPKIAPGLPADRLRRVVPRLRRRHRGARDRLRERPAQRGADPARARGHRALAARRAGRGRGRGVRRADDEVPRGRGVHRRGDRVGAAQGHPRGHRSCRSSSARRRRTSASAS